MSIAEALLYCVLGILIVFFALILLMIIIKVLVKLIPAEETSAKATNSKVSDSPKSESKEFAPGTAGEIKLNGVDPKDAAMCMAIIADELKKPLNELRFISIKEVEE